LVKVDIQVGLVQRLNLSLLKVGGAIKVMMDSCQLVSVYAVNN